MRTWLKFIGLFVVIGFGYAIFVRQSTDSTILSEPVSAQTVNRPLFRLVNGSFRGDYATYELQTPPEEKNFADDCIGCEEEVGNAVIFAEFGCLNKSKYLFESNSKNGVFEKEPINNTAGVSIGERRIWISKNKDGAVVAARMFWIEGEDFWAVQAPSVALTKALFDSEEYRNIRKKVAEEMKAYVPIQNANTKGKNRCENGFYQRRIQH